MSDQESYEFRNVSLVDRLPLILAKTVCTLLMIWSAYLCVIAPELDDRMQNLSFVLFLSWLYANLAVVKYELREFFEPPYFLVGYPIGILSFMLSVIPIYLNWI